MQAPTRSLNFSVKTKDTHPAPGFRENKVPKQAFFPALYTLDLVSMVAEGKYVKMTLPSMSYEEKGSVLSSASAFLINDWPYKKYVVDEKASNFKMSGFWKAPQQGTLSLSDLKKFSKFEKGKDNDTFKFNFKGASEAYLPHLGKSYNGEQAMQFLDTWRVGKSRLPGAAVAIAPYKAILNGCISSEVEFFTVVVQNKIPIKITDLYPYANALGKIAERYPSLLFDEKETYIPCDFGKLRRLKGNPLVMVKEAVGPTMIFGFNTIFALGKAKDIKPLSTKEINKYVNGVGLCALASQGSIVTGFEYEAYTTAVKACCEAKKAQVANVFGYSLDSLATHDIDYERTCVKHRSSVRNVVYVEERGAYSCDAHEVKQRLWKELFDTAPVKVMENKAVRDGNGVLVQFEKALLVVCPECNTQLVITNFAAFADDSVVEVEKDKEIEEITDEHFLSLNDKGKEKEKDQPQELGDDAFDSLETRSNSDATTSGISFSSAATSLGSSSFSDGVGDSGDRGGHHVVGEQSSDDPVWGKYCLEAHQGERVTKDWFDRVTWQDLAQQYETLDWVQVEFPLARRCPKLPSHLTKESVDKLDKAWPIHVRCSDIAKHVRFNTVYLSFGLSYAIIAGHFGKNKVFKVLDSNGTDLVFTMDSSVNAGKVICMLGMAITEARE